MTTTRQLSILLGMDSFVYMVLNQGRIVILKDYALQQYDPKYPHLYQKDLEKIILADKDLRPSFQKVFLGLHHPLAVIVPDGFYDEEQRVAYLNHLTDQADQATILTEALPAIKAKVVYSLNHDIVRTLDHLMPTAHITHLWATMINYLVEHHCRHQTNRHLFINFHRKSVEIFAFDRQLLLLSNTYTFEEAEDVLYYILLVLQELKLDTPKTPIYISGYLIEDSAIYRLLSRFLPGIQFFNGERPYVFGTKMQQLPDHYFVDIMSVSKQSLK